MQRRKLAKVDGEVLHSLRSDAGTEMHLVTRMEEVWVREDPDALPPYYRGGFADKINTSVPTIR